LIQNLDIFNNISNEANFDEKNHTVIEGSKNYLILKLLDFNYKEIEYRNIFFSSYLDFTEPKEVITTLSKNFNSLNGLTDFNIDFRSRILFLLFDWATQCGDLITSNNHFVDTINNLEYISKEELAIIDKK